MKVAQKIVDHFLSEGAFWGLDFPQIFPGIGVSVVEGLWVRLVWCLRCPLTTLQVVSKYIEVINGDKLSRPLQSANNGYWRQS